MFCFSVEIEETKLEVRGPSLKRNQRYVASLSYLQTPTANASNSYFVSLQFYLRSFRKLLQQTNTLANFVNQIAFHLQYLKWRRCQTRKRNEINFRRNSL